MKNISLAILAALISLSVLGQEGESIFTQKCKSCHTIGKGRLVGPDLKDIHTKYEPEKLNNWIRSSQAVIKDGDPKAIALYEEYNKIIMPDFVDLSDADLESLLGYIKQQGNEVPLAEAQSGKIAGNGGLTSTAIVSKEVYSPKKPKFVVNPHTSPIYFGAFLAIIFLIAVLWVLLNAIKVIAAEVSIQRKAETR